MFVQRNKSANTPHSVCVCVCFTFELMTLFVNLVFRISALWFNSQIQEKANLEESKG